MSSRVNLFPFILFLNDAILQTQKYFWIYFWIEFWIYNPWRDEFLWGWSQNQYLLLWNVLLFCSCIEEGEKKFIHSRNRKAFYKKLSAAEKRRRDRRIPCVALHFPKESAWRKLYSSDNDQAMITLTGFNHATFVWVLSMFSTVYDRYTPYSQSWEIIKLRWRPNQKRGRHDSLQHVIVLGYILHGHDFEGPRYASKWSLGCLQHQFHYIFDLQGASSLIFCHNIQKLKYRFRMRKRLRSTREWLLKSILVLLVCGVQWMVWSYIWNNQQTM